MEVAAYKSHPFHVLFIDLVKAFDSVSRSGLWCILRKKGVPPRFLSLLQSYYQDKQTSVSVEGALSPCVLAVYWCWSGLLRCTSLV